MSEHTTETHVSASWLIGRADLLDLDAQRLRELADQADELATRTRELGLHLLVNDPRDDT